MILSLSVFGLEADFALILSFSLAFFGPFLPDLSGTATTLCSPQRLVSEVGSVGVLSVAASWTTRAAARPPAPATAP